MWLRGNKVEATSLRLCLIWGSTSDRSPVTKSLVSSINSVCIFWLAPKSDGVGKLQLVVGGRDGEAPRGVMLSTFPRLQPPCIWVMGDRQEVSRQRAEGVFLSELSFTRFELSPHNWILSFWWCCVTEESPTQPPTALPPPPPRLQVHPADNSHPNNSPWRRSPDGGNETELGTATKWAQSREKSSSWISSSGLAALVSMLYCSIL